MSTANQKAELRTRFLKQRSEQSSETIASASAQICHHILAFISLQGFSKVFLFHSAPGEPAVENLFQQLHPKLKLGLPRVHSKTEIQFHRWDKDTELERSRFGLLEPIAQTPGEVPDKETLICVPSLAMDYEGYRLGFGAAYYDRYLSQHREGVTLAVNFSNCLVDALPQDPWDERVQFLCTEKGVLKVREV